MRCEQITTKEQFRYMMADNPLMWELPVTQRGPNKALENIEKLLKREGFCDPDAELLMVTCIGKQINDWEGFKLEPLWSDSVILMIPREGQLKDIGNVDHDYYITMSGGRWLNDFIVEYRIRNGI